MEESSSRQADEKAKLQLQDARYRLPARIVRK